MACRTSIFADAMTIAFICFDHIALNGVIRSHSIKQILYHPIREKIEVEIEI